MTARLPLQFAYKIVELFEALVADAQFTRFALMGDGDDKPEGLAQIFLQGARIGVFLLGRMFVLGLRRCFLCQLFDVAHGETLRDDARGDLVGVGARQQGARMAGR